MLTNNYTRQERTLTEAESFNVLMRNVYSWMTLGLVITGLMAYFVAMQPTLLYAIATTPALMWGLLIGELVLVVALSAAINKISFRTAGLLFGLYSLVNGATLSVIFVAYTMESIAQAFFISAGMFGAMSLVGYFTKRDLSTIGKICLMLLFGLIIATLVNIFFQNEGLSILLSYAGVIIFTGLTAYDTQKIKKMFLAVHHEGVNDNTNKLALMASLTLYLDFVNLFLYLLRLFGKRK